MYKYKKIERCLGYKYMVASYDDSRIIKMHCILYWSHSAESRLIAMPYSC